MKAILYVYLTYLLVESGVATDLAERQATGTVHTFVAGVYALPMLGALVADRLLGKYHTIIWLSLVYCLGHAFLAIFEGDFTGFGAGLFLIAIGSGGIKPCVSAHVGDQFGKGNWHRVEKVYMVFYFIINFGSFFSTLLIPYLKETFGYSVAFAVPGVLMFVATVFFWMGRKVFVHIPAAPGGKLGAIDVASGFFVFLAVALPMFAQDVFPAYGALAWPLKVMVSAVCLAAGFAIFFYRQRIEADDGFLAVLVYAVRVRFGAPEAPSLQAPPLATDAPGPKSPETPEARSTFWGPAVRRFGQEAAEGPGGAAHHPHLCDDFRVLGPV